MIDRLHHICVHIYPTSPASARSNFEVHAPVKFARPFLSGVLSSMSLFLTYLTIGGRKGSHHSYTRYQYLSIYLHHHHHHRETPGDDMPDARVLVEEYIRYTETRFVYVWGTQSRKSQIRDLESDSEPSGAPTRCPTPPQPASLPIAQPQSHPDTNTQSHTPVQVSSK